MEEKPFWNILELFCDDFVSMAQKSNPAQFLHLSRALLHEIYSVFPPPQVSGHNGQYPISKKKLESGEVQQAVRKGALGWMVDGSTRCIKLAWVKQTVIDAELHNIVRMKKGVLFKRMKKLIGKIPHAETEVPTGKIMMTPIKKILQVKPQIVQWKYLPAAKQAFRDWITLLKEDAREPTTLKELFMRYPNFLVWVDASRESVG